MSDMFLLMFPSHACNPISSLSNIYFPSLPSASDIRDQAKQSMIMIVTTNFIMCEPSKYKQKIS
jgi:hypothetical protein